MADTKEDNILKRRGRLQISTHFLRAAPEAVQLVFANCIPVAVTDYTVARGLIEYWALSKQFDEIDDSTEPPLYIAEVIRQEDDSEKFTVRFRRA